MPPDRLCRAQCGEACLTGSLFPKKWRLRLLPRSDLRFKFTQVDDQLYAYTCSAG
jgi:hypothetical protein